VEKNSSRVIPSSSLDEVEQWAPPLVEGAMAHPSTEASVHAPPTAEELEEIRRQAYAEGYEQGRKEGFDYGHKEALEVTRSEMQQRTSLFDRLIASLDTPLKQLDDEVEQELITLVITMVKQLVRREIQLQPDQIIGVIREALGILPVSARQVRVILNPEDAELVRETYKLHESELSWKIEEDPVLQRGGCRVVTETSHVDATLESRIANLIAPLIGEQRNQEDG